MPRLKKIIFLFVFLLANHQIFAQKKFEIKGIILDSISTKPLEFITINLKSNHSLSSKSTITKNDGSFLLKGVALDKYSLHISAIGYSSKVIALDLISSNNKYFLDLGKIFLRSQNRQLQEVAVKSSRQIVRQEVDRIIYDVQLDPDNKVFNMVEMLQKVPLITFDADDKLQLKGKSNYRIFINGRPSNILSQNPEDVLRSMQASNIQKIEVITVPPSKYESEGIAGIVNIITVKKVADGYNGSVGVMYNSLRSTTVNNIMNFKAGKFGFSSNVGNAWRRFPGSEYAYSRTSASPLSLRIDQDGINENKYGNYIYSFSEITYEVDSLNLLTAVIGLESSHGNQIGSQFNSHYDNNQLSKSYRLNKTEITGRKGLDLSLNYQHNFKNTKDKFLTASYQRADIGYNLESENTAIEKFNYNDNDFQQKNKSGGVEQTLQFDYTNKIRAITLETGLKMVLRDNYSDFVFEDIDPLTGAPVISYKSNKFDYTQNVYGLYNSFFVKLNAFAIKAGFRIERTIINADLLTLGNAFKNGYTNIVPSSALQLKLNNISNLSLGYTQRIRRPGIWELNPFENKSDPNFYSSGNPNLSPAVTHNFELSYSNFKKGSLNAGIDYSFSRNAIQNVIYLGSDNITRSNFYNNGRNSSIGINVNISYPLSTDFNFRFSALTSYLWLNGYADGALINRKGIVGNTNNSINYNFGKDVRTSVNFGFISSSISLQGKRNSYFVSGASISKELFNKKASVFLAVTNPFDPLRNNRTIVNSNTFFQEFNSMDVYRGVRATINYRFGQLKNKSKRIKKGIKNDDIENISPIQ